MAALPVDAEVVSAFATDGVAVIQKSVVPFDTPRTSSVSTITR